MTSLISQAMTRLDLSIRNKNILREKISFYRNHGELMANEYLSTGFTDVDSTRNKEAYFDCLNLLDSLEYYKECKTKSYDLLQLRPGMKVLEAGCGLGDDAFRMARLVTPGGLVVGLDVSNVMIEKARQNELAAQLPVEFQMGDIKALPFPDNSFSRCRIDRVLQHIPQPQKAVTELVRVLEPDGLLLAYDNDWKTFSVASEYIETTRVIEDLWIGSFVNSRIGLHLSGYFVSAGLSDVKIYPGTSVIRDFETGNRVYNLRENVQKAVDVKIISADQGKRWLEELIERDTRDSFMATLTAYTVVGRKGKPECKSHGQ